MSLPTATTIPPRASSINKPFNSNAHDIKKSKRSKEENFELEDNDNWPEEIGLGNIIGDLDADIDADRQNVMSASSSPIQNSSSSSSSTTNPKSNSSKVSTMTSLNTGSGSGGGSATATITQTQQHSSSSSSRDSTSSSKEKDKGLKMKIKRTKTGCRNEPDGKLEIVQQLSSSASGSDISSGSGMANIIFEKS